MEENDTKTSKFSSGLNIIMRLDELWKDTHRHARNGLYNKWNLDLDRMWLELVRDYKEDDESFKKIKAEFVDFDQQISDLGKISDVAMPGFKKVTEEERENRNEHYRILMKKQLFLARLENNLGKGTTFDDGDDDDFD